MAIIQRVTPKAKSVSAKLQCRNGKNRLQNAPKRHAKQAVWLSKTGRFATQNGTRRIRRGEKRRQKRPIRGQNRAFGIYLPKPDSQTFLPKTRPAQQKNSAQGKRKNPPPNFGIKPKIAIFATRHGCPHATAAAPRHDPRSRIRAQHAHDKQNKTTAKNENSDTAREPRIGHHRRAG